MAMPANYIQASAAYGTDQRSPMYNVLWYLPAGGYGTNPQAAANLFAVALEAILKPAYINVLTTESTFFGVSVSLNQAGNVFTAYKDSVGGVGTIEVDELPSLNAVVIQKRTNTPGKSGRGRWYIGAVPETLFAEGILTPTGVVSYEALAAALVATVTASSTTWSAQHHSPKNSELIPIIFAKTTLVGGTQRRRRVRPVLG